MAETDLNKRIRSALHGRDPVRVENAVGPGTPDIEYIGGHIESKQLPAFPKRPETVVAVDHYVQAQRAWHVRRCKAGGRVHVVIEVAGETFVFDALAAAQHLGVDWARLDMIRESLLYMHKWNRATFRAFINKCDADRA